MRSAAFVPTLFLVAACGLATPATDETLDADLPGLFGDDAEPLGPSIPCGGADVCVTGQVRPTCTAAARETSFNYDAVQEFSVTRTGGYRFLRLNVRRLGRATGVLRARLVSLPSASADPATGTVLGTASIAGNLLPTASGAVTFKFDASVPLVAGGTVYALWFDVPAGRLTAGLGCSALQDPLPGRTSGFRTRRGTSTTAFRRAVRDVAFALGDSATGPGPCQSALDAACDDGNGSSGDGCSASCTIESGYRCPTLGAACVDVDECAEDTDDCHPLGTCTNTTGGFTCACPASLVGDGRTCVEFDACASHPCATGVTCTDVPGTSNAFGTGYTCGPCPDDTWGDGRTCTTLTCPVGFTNTATGCVVRPRPTIGFNNEVSIVATYDGLAYLGGRISRAGYATGTGAVVDATSGAFLRANSPRILGGISCVTPDASTGWYVGGSFSHVNGTARPYLAHVLSDGSLDPQWTQSPDGPVNAIALSGGVLYAGGTFGTVGGQARARLAAFDASTGQRLAWNPGADGSVDALAVSGGTVFAGGTFTTAGGLTRTRLAAFDASTGAATAWDPGADGQVLALAVSGSTVYAGGAFTVAGGLTRNRLAAFDASTGTTTSWNPDANATVAALTTGPGAIWAAGDFTAIGGTARNRLASIDPVTGTLGGFSTNFSSARVSAIAVASGVVYAAGAFTLAGSLPRFSGAAFDTATSAMKNFDPSALGGASAVAVRGSQVFLAGGISIVNQAVRRVVSADPSTGGFGGWGVNAPGVVTGLAVRGNDVIVSGAFSTVNGQGRSNIAAVDAVTAALRPFNPGANDWVYRVAASTDRVFAIGNFTSAAGISPSTFVAIDAATGAGLPQFPKVDGYIDSVTVGEGKVFLSGAFTTVGGEPRERLAAIDATTGALLPWNPGADATPSTMAVKDGVLYVGGFFTRIAGVNRPWLAAIDIATGQALPWNPAPDYGVLTMQFAGTKLFIGGWFSNVGGQPRAGLAAVDQVTGAPTAWNPAPSGGSVRSLAIDRGVVFVGGEFTSVDGFPTPSLAVFGQ